MQIESYEILINDYQKNKAEVLNCYFSLKFPSKKTSYEKELPEDVTDIIDEYRWSHHCQ